MNNVKPLTDLNTFFKETYKDKLDELLGYYNDFKWNKEKTKFYWDPLIFMPQNPFLNIINNTKAPYTKKVDKKTLILEIE